MARTCLHNQGTARTPTYAALAINFRSSVAGCPMHGFGECHVLSTFRTRAGQQARTGCEGSVDIVRKLPSYRACDLVILRAAANATLRMKEAQKNSHSQRSTVMPLKDQLIFLSVCSK